MDTWPCPEWPPPLTVISPIKCVKNEIHNVLTVLRLTHPYTARFVGEVEEEDPLVSSFRRLFDSLSYVNEFHLEAEHIEPFLSIIECPETNGSITAVALAAINKVVVYGLIRPNSPGCMPAINAVARGVLNCKFKGSGTPADEVVLLKILNVLVDTLRSPSGQFLTDHHVWQMVRKCYQISRQPRASYLLRSSSEHILQQMMLAIFSSRRKAHNSVPNVEGAVVTDKKKAELRPYGADAMYKTLRFLAFLTSYGHRKGSPSYAAGTEDLRNRRRGRHRDVAGISPAGDGSGVIGASDDERSSVEPSLETLNSNVEEELTLPYVNPVTEDSEICKELRSLGLSLLNVALETGGEEVVRSDGMLAVIQGPICKSLLLNAHSDSLFVLSLTLRCVFNLFVHFKRHLKVQLEIFFHSIHLRIAAPLASHDLQKTPALVFEQRELALESMLEFCREPELMLELYENYDCDVLCTNLFELLSKFLSSTLSPHRTGDQPSLDRLIPSPLTTINRYALTGVCWVIAAVGSRCQAPVDYRVDTNDDDDVPMSIGTSERQLELRRRKEKKKRLAFGAQVFNGESSKCVGPLQNLGLLPMPVTPESFARFLKETPNLDSAVVGEYLAKPSDWNSSVRQSFFKTFNFAGMPVVEALRQLLATFRVPGESQQIERIVESFASEFFVSQPTLAVPVEDEVSDQLRRPRWTSSESWYWDVIETSVSQLTAAEHLTPAQLLAAVVAEWESSPVEAPPPGCVLIRSSDCIFVLSYSIIMLQTDLHNTQIKNKMKLEEFIRNNRGINDGDDLPPPFLRDVYEAIRADPIRLYDDSADVTTADADHYWDRILKKSEQLGQYIVAGGASPAPSAPGRPSLHERDMFTVLWSDADILSSLRRALISTHDLMTMSQCLGAIGDLQRIAYYFSLTEPLNILVATTTRFVNADLTPRAQLALPLVIHSLACYSSGFRRPAWEAVVEFFLCLFSLGLLPQSLTEFDDFFVDLSNSGHVIDRLCRLVPPPTSIDRRFMDKDGPQKKSQQSGGWSLLNLFVGSDSDDDADSDSSSEVANSAMADAKRSLKRRNRAATKVVVSTCRQGVPLFRLYKSVRGPGDSRGETISKKPSSVNTTSLPDPLATLRTALIQDFRIDELLLGRLRAISLESVWCLAEVLMSGAMPPAPDVIAERAKLWDLTKSEARRLVAPPNHRTLRLPPWEFAPLIHPSQAHIEEFRNEADSVFCLELLTQLLCIHAPTPRVNNENSDIIPVCSGDTPACGVSPLARVFWLSSMAFLEALLRLYVPPVFFPSTPSVVDVVSKLCPDVIVAPQVAELVSVLRCCSNGADTSRGRLERRELIFVERLVVSILRLGIRLGTVSDQFISSPIASLLFLLSHMHPPLLLLHQERIVAALQFFVAQGSPHSVSRPLMCTKTSGMPTIEYSILVLFQRLAPRRLSPFRLHLASLAAVPSIRPPQTLALASLDTLSTWLRDPAVSHTLLSPTHFPTLLQTLALFALSPTNPTYSDSEEIGCLECPESGIEIAETATNLLSTFAPPLVPVVDRTVSSTPSTDVSLSYSPEDPEARNRIRAGLAKALSIVAAFGHRAAYGKASADIHRLATESQDTPSARQWALVESTLLPMLTYEFEYAAEGAWMGQSFAAMLTFENAVSLWGLSDVSTRKAQAAGLLSRILLARIDMLSRTNSSHTETVEEMKNLLRFFATISVHLCAQAKIATPDNAETLEEALKNLTLVVAMLQFNGCSKQQLGDLFDDLDQFAETLTSKDPCVSATDTPTNIPRLLMTASRWLLPSHEHILLEVQRLVAVTKSTSYQAEPVGSVDCQAENVETVRHQESRECC